MNEYQQNLWDGLMALQSRDAFYYVDQFHNGHLYRIFLYRLASYTDFCEPFALDSRGTMFEISSDGSPLRLACRPLRKFFNLNENPMTMNLDLADISHIYAKEDGSLISTYAEDGKVYLKTKGSLTSEQAVAAMEWLSAHPELSNAVNGIVSELDVTLNFEWTSPKNQIVLAYPGDSLYWINAQSNEEDKEVVLECEALQRIRVADYITSAQSGSYEKFLDTIPGLVGIEGYVVQLESGQRIKMKTEWYLVRHRVKDSVNHPRHLFEAIINEAVDDVKSLFVEDPQTIARIQAMESKVIPQYNAMIKEVESFHQMHHELSRKDYAILAQSQPNNLMPLYMSAYLGRLDMKGFREFACKNYKDYIGDTTEVSNEDSD